MQAERSQVRVSMRSLNFINLLRIHLAALGTGVYLASSSNEYQEKQMFLEVELGLCVRISPQSVNHFYRQYRQYGILDITQPNKY
jgi:hypothetical protein